MRCDEGKRCEESCDKSKVCERQESSVLAADLSCTGLQPDWGHECDGTWVRYLRAGPAVSLFQLARSKLRVDPCGLGEGLGRLGTRATGVRMRLDSQSSENLPFPAVEG
ncbi:hypothetical protein BT93_D0334 [Corymbia citriodora subsp. variegata]|nr:hypothetical protein BT93_D0334 [Corymbia citriodora subsp. variegata]